MASHETAARVFIRKQEQVAMQFDRSEKRAAWVDRFIDDWLNPDTGVADISSVSVSPDGSKAAVLALVGKPSGPVWKVALIDTATGELEVVSASPRSDGEPKFSPDGATLAYRADRGSPGDFSVILLDIATRTERTISIADHWIEYLEWSPTGNRLLVGAAVFGANVGAIGGAKDSKCNDAVSASWVPMVHSDANGRPGRSIWICNPSRETCERLTDDMVNPWRACWNGDEAIVMIASDLPEEDSWYNATLRRVSLGNGGVETIYRPDDQLVGLSASPDGQRIAVIDALCSDRDLGAGKLILVEPTGHVERIALSQGDAAWTAWRDPLTLVLTVLSYGRVALFELAADTREIRVLSAREDRSIGNRFIPSFWAANGLIAVIEEGWTSAPAIKLWQAGAWRTIYQCGSRALDARLSANLNVRELRWQSSDGLEIEGDVLFPEGDAPFPMVAVVHGGPTYCAAPGYVGRPDTAIGVLLEAGYAVFRPNFRGSSGRGRAFAAACFGDAGGREGHDVLTGIDLLIKEGLADPSRLGVTGGSYGGYLSAWLITQDDRFAASVPVCPVTNWVSLRLSCNIPAFCDVILESDMEDNTGRYFSSSPVMFASRVKTPTLTICGLLDNCTPPGQALEFHTALRLNGVRSEVVMYPEEGHGIQGYPAKNDYLARVVDWFQTFMPANEH
jgi:dipeptidyl aminopeptidase/acylaminoacyl peptidase